MNNVVNKKNLKYWDKLYEKYRNDDVVSDNWLWVFNQIINDNYGPVIDLGCGSGNDIMYLLGKGKKVSMATRDQVEQISLIVFDLKELLNN